MSMLRTYSRVGVVAAAAMTTPAWAQDPTLHCMATNAEIAWPEVRGHHAAFHFVPNPTAAAGTAFAKEYAGEWPTVAGVRHVLVVSEAGVADWATQFRASGINVVDDTSGVLAAYLRAFAGGVSGVPVTIVLSPGGTELFRRSGASEHDTYPFREFAASFVERARLGALRDYNLPKGSTLALEGYDPVSYFTAGKPARGKAEIATNHRGVTYRFASAENRRLFAQSPEKYLPTYGGWCASAMGDGGRKVGIDPTNFKVKDGRLFLFYLGTFADAKKDWNKREKEWEPAADRNWKRLTNEDPIKP